MIRLREFVGAIAVTAAVAIVPFSGAALAHGDNSEDAAHLHENMADYAGDIRDLIASVDEIVADYQPGDDYSAALDGLVEQWEHVDFHEAVEEMATPLYPPIWAAIGALSSTIGEGAPTATVQARGDAIAAALWQGYGALKLIDAGGVDTEHGEKHASGADVIDTINNKLDLVLIEYKEGETEEALEIIHATYMGYFEGIEGDLIEQDAQLVSDLEMDFNATLPGLIKEDAAADKVAEQIKAMKTDLDKARKMLATAEKQESEVF